MSAPTLDEQVDALFQRLKGLDRMWRDMAQEAKAIHVECSRLSISEAFASFPESLGL